MSRSRLQFLDTLRGFAILGVFFYHAIWQVGGHPMRWKDGLWDPHGFELYRSIFQYALQCYSIPSMFFLMSGYLIHRSQVGGRRIDLRYAVRRNLRLYLPYLLVLLVFAAAYLTPKPLTFSAPDAAQMFLHVTLLFVYGGADSAWAINPSFWFVAAEIQLCFLYLLWWAVIRRFGWKGLMLSLLFVELATRVAATLWLDWLYISTSSYMFTWMLGALLAQQQQEGRLPERSGIKAAAWGVVIVLATGVEVLEYFTSLALAAGTYYLISWLLQRPEREEAFAASTAPSLGARGMNFVRLVGQISLWAYLLNQPILQYIERALIPYAGGPMLRIFATALVGWVIVLPLAWLLQRYVEPKMVKLIDALVAPPGRGPAGARSQAAR